MCNWEKTGTAMEDGATVLKTEPVFGDGLCVSERMNGVEHAGL